MKKAIPGEPVSKPRQTQRDKWQKRPNVMKYRAWADEVRLRMGQMPGDVGRLDVVFYFTIPTRRKGLAGTPHRQRPDIDNCIKAVMDALFHQDSAIHQVSARKFWDDGLGPRTEITLL